MRRIGMLAAIAADEPEAQARNASFLQRLGELGWTVGRNVRIDYRWAADNADDIRRYATELVALVPDVILATSGATVGALQQASRSVPIVFAGTIDPVGNGFVDSLARPGGNTTGFFRMLNGLTSTPSVGATAWMTPNWAFPAGLAVSRRIAARVVPGATCVLLLEGA